MKLAFIYSFNTQNIGKPVKWLPLGTSSLIANLREDFEQIKFVQIDIDEELMYAIKKGKLPKEYLKTKREIFLAKKVPTNEELHKYKTFFADIIKLTKLDTYDHYLFANYSSKKQGLIANFYLAKYLKNEYKEKKIIFGPVALLDFFKVKSRRELFSKYGRQIDFMDSTVGAPGEKPTAELITDLMNKKTLKMFYLSSTLTPHDRFKDVPDYESFLSKPHFNWSSVDLAKLYNTELAGSSDKKEILFIPYYFSLGCFYGRCAYCPSSNNGVKSYYKPIKEVINDIKKLKILHKSKYFIFFNDNFNANLSYAKELLKAMIAEKLDILWTDSFNLMVMDDEMIELLARAGCFRMDIGVTTVDPKLQKKYNNLLNDNKYLANLEKISKQGIYTHINIVLNMPYQYKLENEINPLKKYINHIDAATVNNYLRKNESLLDIKYEDFGLSPINEELVIKSYDIRKLYFIENDFKGSLEERKQIAAKLYNDYLSFLNQNKVVAHHVNLYLLGWLYNKYGFANKKKIKEIVWQVSQNLNNIKSEFK